MSYGVLDGGTMKAILTAIAALAISAMMAVGSTNEAKADGGAVAAAGAAGLGVFTSAKNNNGESGFPNPLWVIGVDSPQMYLGTDDPDTPVAPTVGLTSMLKRVDVAVYQVISSVRDGTFSGGFSVFNLSNGGLGYETSSRACAPRYRCRNCTDGRVFSRRSTTGGSKTSWRPGSRGFAVIRSLRNLPRCSNEDRPGADRRSRRARMF